MAKDNKNLLIKSKSSTPLKPLNESANPQKKEQYIFEGIFTACSTPDHIVINRNNRRYDETEVLKHLKYLRENILQNGNLLLGECDHPVDRFDTQIKEAAVATTNLWYDFKNHNLMGRMKILDTPNGHILKTLVVDEGYPLYVSSRACGEVHDGVVKIQQIFCWDAVVTPGFQEAELKRVVESCDTPTGQYLTESYHGMKKEKKNSDKKYGVLFEGVTACEVDEEPPIDEYDMKIKNSKLTEEDLKELAHPLNEGEEEPEKSDDASFSLPHPDMNPNTIQEEEDKKDDDKDEKSDDSKDTSDEKKSDSDDKKDDEKKSTLTDEEKADRRAKILGIQAIDANDENKDEKEEKRSKILSIKTENKSDDKSEKSVEKKDDVSDKDTEKAGDELGDILSDENNKDDKKDDEKKSNDKKSDEKKDKHSAEETEEPDVQKNQNTVNAPNEIKTKEQEATAKEVAKKALNDKEATKDLENQTKKDMDKISELLKKAKKMKDVKESICKSYPFAISLSDENFAKFAALKPASKNIVQKFIMEHNIYDIESINELWTTPLVEAKRNMKNWLRLASDEDKRLFTEAPMDVQDAIEESAKYVMIQTKEDADKFWERTGLRQRNASRILNESMANRYDVDSEKENVKKSNTSNLAASMGYHVDYFKMLEDMY